jgi:hypothetical protein
VPIFLYCDTKTPPPMFEAMTRGLPRRVTVCGRIPTRLASWSLARAELTALCQARARTPAEHIAVLSGSDDPLVSMQALLDELRAWRGRSSFRNVPLPFAGWGSRGRQDGGRWRLQHLFLTFRDKLIHVRGIPLRWPVKRRVPPELRRGRHRSGGSTPTGTPSCCSRLSTRGPISSVSGARPTSRRRALPPLCSAAVRSSGPIPLNRVSRKPGHALGPQGRAPEVADVCRLRRSRRCRHALPANPEVVTSDHDTDTAVARARKLFAHKVSAASTRRCWTATASFADDDRPTSRSLAARRGPSPRAVATRRAGARRTVRTG